MGQEVLELVASSDQWNLLGTIDSKTSLEKLNSDEKSAVVVDFSVASFFSKILSWCEHEGLALVSGTTGLTDESFQALDKAAKKFQFYGRPI